MWRNPQSGKKKVGLEPPHWKQRQAGSRSGTLSTARKSAPIQVTQPGLGAGDAFVFGLVLWFQGGSRGGSH